MATPSDPGLTYQLVGGLGLIGATAQATRENLFAWCRDNMLHFVGVETPDNNEAHWGFKGYPAVENILKDTDRQLSGGSSEFSHWTAGCWGATASLKLVGRTLNIPVALVKLRVPGDFHATLHFVAESLSLVARRRSVQLAQSGVHSRHAAGAAWWALP